MKRAALIVFSIITTTLFNLSSASALTSQQWNSVYGDSTYYDPTGTNIGSYSGATTVPVGCFSGSSLINSPLPSAVPSYYVTLFTQAAAAYKTSVELLTALFLTENGNAWKDPNGSWGTSSQGAQGPFQFEPGTWAAYAVSPNGGQPDVNNIVDAAYSAANLLHSNGVTDSTPLGNINTPFAPGTLLYAAAAYNWGGGAVQEGTSPSSPITVAPSETQAYLQNVYTLITSGFTKVGPGEPALVNLSGSNGSSAPSSQGQCSSSVLDANIAEEAASLSWPDGPHGLTSTTAYAAAITQYNPQGTSSYNGADCGAFVATVLHASGADLNYPALGTYIQEPYMKNNPNLYQSVQNLGNTSDLQPGDIFVINVGSGAGADGHTFIYIGNGMIAEASEGGEMPFQEKVFFSDYRGNYDIYRFVGSQ